MDSQAFAIDDSFDSHSGPPVKHHNGLKLSPAESTAYAKLFKIADVAATGLILPAAAVAFLSKSRLPKNTLGLIWSLSDTDNLGALDSPAFNRALKYIAAAQGGHPITPDSLSITTVLPVFDGVHIDVAPALTSQTHYSASSPLLSSDVGSTPMLSIPTQLTGNRMMPQKTGDSLAFSPTQASDAHMTVTSEERERFTSFFNAANPVNGSITAQVARELFLKSNLPIEALGKIWQLVDPTGSGKLPLNQFIVAMHLITEMRLNRLVAVPTSISPALWKSASMALNSSAPQSPSTSGEVSSSITAVPRSNSTFWDTHQNAGGQPFGFKPSNVQEPISMAHASPTSTSVPVARNFIASTESIISDAFVVPEDEKKKFFAFFDQLDTNKRGYLTGEESSSFFLKSRLPSADLAQIWEYVDVTKSGKISRDGFATAMFFISKRMAGGDLPPTSMINMPLAVDSVRLGSTTDLTYARGTAPALLDSFDPSNSAPASESVAHIATQPAFDLFGPERTLDSTSMAQNNSTAYLIPQIPAAASHYREAAEREAELNRRKEEVTSLTEQLKLLHPTAEELKKKRSDIDAEYKQVTDEKNKLTIQISQMRATYEAEVQIVRDSQNFLMTEVQRLESSKLELNQIEKAVASIKVEKTNLSEQAARYQQEISESKKNIQILTEETNQWRTELEKLRVDSRQQQQLADLNQKLLLSAQIENHQFKMDLAQERERLEHAKQKAVQFQQQASVLQAINQKELAQIKAAEQQRIHEVSQSQDLLAATTATKDLAPAAAPLVPSLASKPIKGEPFSTLVSDSVVHNSDKLKATRSLSGSSTSPVSMADPQSVVTRKSQDEFRAKDTSEPNDIFTSNMPKPNDSGSGNSSAKSIQSMHAGATSVIKEHSIPISKSVSASPQFVFGEPQATSPVISQISSTLPVQSVTSTSLPASATTAFPSSFDDVFGPASVAIPASKSATSFGLAHSATTTVAPHANSPASDPAKLLLTSSASSSAKKAATSLQNFDIDAEFQNAFSGDKRLNAARDSSTVQSIHQGISRVKPNDFSADAFTFDASFSDAKPIRSNTPSSKLNFETVFDAPLSSTSVKSIGNALPITSATKDFGPVDFGNASDPVGMANSAASTTVASFSTKAGGSASSTVPTSVLAEHTAKGFDEDPFGAVDFNKALSLPHT
ncbi:hypothetical protein O5D80_000821 [Batrachochytrium dendrobatidis]|nr:hypothetical protein O5D80_000821 [Batrachochytrium dendrobatidis]